jgi:hypothetical protein
MASFKASTLKKLISQKVMRFHLQLTSYATICHPVGMQELHSTWGQRDQLLTSTQCLKWQVSAKLATRQVLPRPSCGTELNLSTNTLLSNKMGRILSKTWNPISLLGTSNMRDMFQRMPIPRFSKIEVSMTAKSLSIALMKIILLTWKHQVWSMSQHFHQSKRIMQQV